MKKRGFGAGKWNGPGGKVKETEKPRQAIIREVREEINVNIEEPKELGYLEFIWPKDKEDKNQRCYIYFVNKFTGQPQETEECLPQWFAINKIPYKEMWDDDKYWYPDVLRGKAIKKRFFFNLNNKVLKFEDI